MTRTEAIEAALRECVDLLGGVASGDPRIDRARAALAMPVDRCEPCDKYHAMARAYVDAEDGKITPAIVAKHRRNCDGCMECVWWERGFARRVALNEAAALIVSLAMPSEAVTARRLAAAIRALAARTT